MVLCHLIVLAVEQFSAITRPLYYVKWCRQRNIFWRIIIIWVLPFVEVPLVVLWVFTKYLFFNAYTIVFIMMYACLIVMCIVYVLICKEVKKQQSWVNGLNGEDKFRYKALFTTIFILLTYFVCWAPSMVFWVIGETAAVDSELKSLLRYITVKLACLNSICDPLICSLWIYKVQNILRRSYQSCFKDRCLCHSNDISNVCPNTFFVTQQARRVSRFILQFTLYQEPQNLICEV